MSDFGLEVDDDLVSLFNAEVLGFGAYDATFEAMKYPVSNGDFILFLNTLLGLDQLLIDGALIYSQSETYSAGKLLVDLTECLGIILADGAFSTAFANNSVTGATWHAANAYALWLTLVRGDGLYVLPSEWEWELLNEAGYVTPRVDRSVSNISYNTSVSGYGYTDGVYPSAGVSSLLTGPGEWVASDSINNSTYASVRGVGIDQFTQLALSTEREGYLPKSYSSNKLGFRLIKKASTQHRSINSDAGIIFELDQTTYAPGDSGLVTLLFSDNSYKDSVISIASSDPRIVVGETLAITDTIDSYRVDFTIAEEIDVLGVEVVSITFLSGVHIIGQVEITIRNIGTTELILSSNEIDINIGQSVSLMIDKPLNVANQQPVYLSGSAVSALNLPSQLGFITNPTQELLTLSADTDVNPGVYYLNLSNSDIQLASTVITVSASVNLDTDSDGMPDWWEVEKGLDQNNYDPNVDYDLDGMSNIEEYFFDTNPKVTNQRPALEMHKTEAGYQLRFDSSINRRYQVRASSDMINWSNFGDEYSGVDMIEVPITTTERNFYRLKVHP